MRSRQDVLTFRVCSGLVNQRLAIIDGLMLGALLNFSVVLPDLNNNGVELNRADQSAALREPVPFDALYSSEDTIRNLAPLVHVKTVPPPPCPECVHLQLAARQVAKPAEWWRKEVDGFAGGAPVRLELDCPLFALQKHGRKSQRLFWEVDRALVFAAPVVSAAYRIVKQLRSLDSPNQRSAHGGDFTVLHLRAETDWVLHCKAWEQEGQDTRTRAGAIGRL